MVRVKGYYKKVGNKRVHVKPYTRKAGKAKPKRRRKKR
jgi:hypothetical protein